MSGESVCQVAHSWVDVGSFPTCSAVRFMIFTASVRNILDKPPYFRGTDWLLLQGGGKVQVWLVRYRSLKEEP
jgi:hypothetical protein